MDPHDKVDAYLCRRFGIVPSRGVYGHWSHCQCRVCLVAKRYRHEYLELALVTLRSELGVRFRKAWAYVSLDEIEFELEAAAELVMAREGAGKAAA